LRERLRRETLAEQVARALLDIIEEQGLKPGTALPSEARLTEEFGVSRHVVREALRSLEARGIITVANGKGATVRAFSDEVIRDYFRTAVRFQQQRLMELLEVRRGIEIQSAFLAAQRRTDDDLTQLAEALAAMRQHLYDATAYVTGDARLHLLIARASHNTLLYHLIGSIREPLQDTIRAGYSRSSIAEIESLPSIHAAIVSAIERGDGPGATRAMEHHFDGAMTGIVKELAERLPSLAAVDGPGTQSRRRSARRPRQQIAAIDGKGDDGNARPLQNAEREN
jgi:DNA-binding FadR family transcriptional regulator